MVGLRYEPQEGPPQVIVKGSGKMADEILRQRHPVDGPMVVKDAELLEQLYRLPMDAQQPFQFRRKEADPRQMEVQQRRIQGKLSIRLKAQHLPAKRLGKPRLAVGRQPHHDVFVLVRYKSEVRGHSRVELAERMGQRGALQHANVPAFSGRQHGRMRLGCAVHDEDRRLLER